MSIIDAMLPMAFFILLGYFLRAVGLIDEKVKTFLNKLLFYFALPAMAFRSIASFDFEQSFSLALGLHNLTVLLITFAVGMVFAFLLKNKKQRGSFHQAWYRNNQAYVGLHVTKSVFGELALAKATLVNGFEIPVVNIIAIIGLEIFKDDGIKISFKKKAQKTLLNVFKNPFLISITAGILVSIFKIPVLSFTALDNTLEMAGRVALPMALILIGGSMTLSHLKDHFVMVSVISLVRLLAVPVLAYFLGIWVFNLSGLDLSVAVTLLSTPVAISSYVFAKEMGADENLMASFIGLSTIFSIITMPIINIILKL